MDNKLLNLELPLRTTSIIKVVGVGGGGGNAVNHMYDSGIHDVTFALCNTDNQALAESPVPVKIQLGIKTTAGLGAGNRPDVAKAAAEESEEMIQELLSDGTEMVFVTAGMGGGTGTGSAPVVARIAKDLGILTVGIVTVPFMFEGNRKIVQALRGVDNIAKNVDALLVINNERLREIYKDFSVKNAFAKADDTLKIAAKSIAEIITMHGHVNLDFADVRTVLKDGGVAIMSTGRAKGENRVSLALKNALNSPLLNNNDIFDAKKILLNIVSDDSAELAMEELDEVNHFMNQFDENIEVIFGIASEAGLGEEVKIMLLATGFGLDSVPGIGEYKGMETILQETERKVKEEEQKKKKEEEELLISKYYGKEKVKLNTDAKFCHTPFVLTLEEMDNDKILEALDKNPVFKRERGFNPRMGDYELNSPQGLFE